jgi:hypothetical protein
MLFFKAFEVRFSKEVCMEAESPTYKFSRTKL